jgi:large subunit ribosomal protein L17
MDLQRRRKTARKESNRAMRHRKAGLKLSRKTGHLNSLFRNQVTSLFKYDRIRTTVTKAKELRRWADHLVTLAKRGDLHARRQALAIVQERDVVQKLFEKAAERFGSVSGGYTRLVRLGLRAGDSAPMMLVELIGREEDKKKKKGKKKSAKAAAGKAKGAPKVAESKEGAGAASAVAKKAKAAEAAQGAAGPEEKPAGE